MIRLFNYFIYCGLKRSDRGGNFSASPVLAGGNIYVPNEQGTTFVFSSGPQFELLAENDPADGGFASPVMQADKSF